MKMNCHNRLDSMNFEMLNLMECLLTNKLVYFMVAEAQVPYLGIRKCDVVI
jgi:hypothetical protein